ncbi:MAG: hypothetical protein FH753_14880 [Firmicutes bacterium]|nr:hypothetical protein [Bacillota bacterium]
MKHEIKKVSKILDELVTFCFTHGTKDMNINIKETKEYFKMTIESDNVNCNDERVKRLNELLAGPRQSEMEEHYWELTGESDCDTELTLVGMMIDKVDIKFDNSSLTMVLFRYK